MLTPFLKSISYLLHPLLMPWIGAVYYFSVTPIQYPAINISFWLVSIIFWCVILPLILYYILKKMNVVQTIHLKTSKDRIWPLLLNSLIIGNLSFNVLSKSTSVELHYLFLGVMITALLAMKYLLRWMQNCSKKPARSG